MSYNAWLYVYSNPINQVDPSGMIPADLYDGRGIPPVNACYPLTGDDRLACEKIIRGVSPNAQVTLAELKMFDFSGSCGDFPGSTQPPITIFLNGGDGVPYGYWYHYLLQWTNGSWNNNGTKHVTFRQLIAFSLGVEVDGVAVDSLGKEKMAEAFGRKGWGEGMYRFIGGRQSVQSRVNLGLFGNPLGGGYNVGNQTKFIAATNMDRDQYAITEGSDIYSKASMILDNVDWRSGVLGKAPYEWANIVDTNWINSSAPINNEDHSVAYIYGCGQPGALYILTKTNKTNSVEVKVVLSSQKQILNLLGCISCIILLLPSCVPFSSAQPLTTSVPPKFDGITKGGITFTPEIKNTEEPTVISPFVTSTARASSCPTVQDKKEEISLSKGTIIIDPGDSKLGLQKYNPGMDFPTSFLRQLPCCTYMLFPSYWISPDRKWLALTNERYDSDGKYAGTSLVITNGDDNSSLIIPQAKNWTEIYTWVNNSQLLLIPSNTAVEGTLLLFDPFHSSTKEVRPTFPNLLPSWLNYRPNGWRDAPGRPIYDPSMTKVIFYSYDSGREDHRAIVLWDLKTVKEVWRKSLSITPIPELESTRPVWSPNGEQFAFFTIKGNSNDQIELLLVDQSGHEMKINNSNYLQSLHRAGGLGWSPNGKYLSFFVEDKDEERLLIYNLTTQQIWDPCIVEPKGQSKVYFRQPVVWSPDSQQFLVNSDESSVPYYLVVDVHQREIVNLNFRFRSAVWLSPFDANK